MEIKRVQRRIGVARRRIARDKPIRSEKRGQVDERLVLERLERRLLELKK